MSSWSDIYPLDLQTGGDEGLIWGGSDRDLCIVVVLTCRNRAGKLKQANTSRKIACALKRIQGK